MGVREDLARDLCEAGPELQREAWHRLQDGALLESADLLESLAQMHRGELVPAKPLSSEGESC